MKNDPPNGEKRLFRVLDDCQLVHPVHERVALFHNALKFAADTGYQLVTGEKIAGIDRHLLGPQEVGLDTLFLELDSFDETAVFQFLDDPGTFPAVNTQLFPELALKYTFRLRLNQFQSFIYRISHVVSPRCNSDYRCNSEDIVTPDHNCAKAPAPLVIDKLGCLFHVDVEIFVHRDKAPLQLAAFIFYLDGYL